MGEIRKRITFHGRVQGVGFRYTARLAAGSLGLTGWAKNEYDGTVTMEVQGSEGMINKLLVRLNTDHFIRNGWTVRRYRFGKMKKDFRSNIRKSIRDNTD